jgi:hypothetical protein
MGFRAKSEPDVFKQPKEVVSVIDGGDFLFLELVCFGKSLKTTKVRMDTRFYHG